MDNNEIKNGDKKITKRKKHKETGKNLTPEEWLDRFYMKSSLKSRSAKKSKKEASAEKFTGNKNKLIRKDEVKNGYSELMLKPLTIFSKGDELFEKVKKKINMDGNKHPIENNMEENKSTGVVFKAGVVKKGTNVVMNEKKVLPKVPMKASSVRKINNDNIKSSVRQTKKVIGKQNKIMSQYKENDKQSQFNEGVGKEEPKFEQKRLKNVKNDETHLSKEDDKIVRNFKTNLKKKTKSIFESLMLRNLELLNESNFTEETNQHETNVIRKEKSDHNHISIFKHFPVEGKSNDEGPIISLDDEKVPLIKSNMLENHEFKEIKNISYNDERQRIIEALVDLKEKVDRQIYSGLQVKGTVKSDENKIDKTVNNLPSSTTIENVSRETRANFKPSPTQYSNWFPIFNPSKKITTDFQREGRSVETKKKDKIVFNLKQEILEKKEEILTEINNIQKATAKHPLSNPEPVVNRRKKAGRIKNIGNVLIFKRIKNYLKPKWLQI